MNTSHKLLLAAVSSFGLALALACGGANEEPGDDDPIVTPPGSGGAGSGGAGSGGATAGSGGGFEEPDREACPDEPDGAQPESHLPVHRGTPCWNVRDCNIVKPEQAKNQCTSSQCFPYDNTENIQGYTAGDPLPPL